MNHRKIQGRLSSRRCLNQAGTRSKPTSWTELYLPGPKGTMLYPPSSTRHKLFKAGKVHSGPSASFRWWGGLRNESLRKQGRFEKLPLYLTTDSTAQVVVFRHLCILEVGQGCRQLCHWSNWAQTPRHRKHSFWELWKGREKQNFVYYDYSFILNTIINYS